MHTLQLTLPIPRALMALRYPNGKQGGLTLEGAAPAPLGTLVTVQVTCVAPARAFEVLGQLAWARPRSSSTRQGTFGVDFVPEGEGARRRLFAFARGELSEAATRQFERNKVPLRVKVVHAGNARAEQLVDLSLGGALIRMPLPLPLSAQLELVIRPPRALLPMRLKARVVRVESRGETSGVGVAFSEPSASAQVDKLLARLARAG
jgi:Tfp pilus assembly protein PilZ